MSASLARTEHRGRWLALTAVVCLALGVVTGIDPLIGLVGAAGLVFAAVTFVDVTIGLALFTVVSFLAVLTGGGASLAKLAGLLLFASWYVSRMSKPRTLAETQVRAPSTVLIGSVGLLGWSLVSALWAVSPGHAFSSTERYLLVILLVPIVVSAADSPRALRLVMAAFVTGAAISAIWGFGNPTSEVAAGRAGGAVGDPNEQAAVLVAALPMALALLRHVRGRRGLQALLLVAILICLVGTMQTASRGGLVALAAILIAGVFFGGRWRGSAMRLLTAIVVIGVAYFALFATQTQVQHITSSNTDGRNDLYTLGLRMFRAHPLTGVGSGNYVVAEPRYQLEPGVITRVDITVAKPKVGHNVYLQFLAELGIPGLVLLLLIVGGALVAGYRAVRIIERAGDDDLELTARALVLSLLAMLAANAFISDEFSKQLWLIIGMNLAINVIARRRVWAALHRPDSEPEPLAIRPVRGRARPIPVPQ